MASKKRRPLSVAALCVALLLSVCLCGCDDLGVYEDPQQYYDSFGSICLIGGEREDDEYPRAEYSVEEYFYNTASREDFLEDDSGVYSGVPEKEYIYMAIPLRADLCLDSIALYLRSSQDVVIYVSAFLVDEIPEKIRGIGDPAFEVGEEDGVEVEEPIVYDDPPRQECLADTTVLLEAGKWGSFLMDSFLINGSYSQTVSAESGQYVLLLFRNNSDAVLSVGEAGERLDAVTGNVLEGCTMTMTNLLMRAIDPEPAGET